MRIPSFVIISNTVVALLSVAVFLSATLAPALVVAAKSYVQTETAYSFTGTYRLDPARSDKLFSIVSNVAANLPPNKQQERTIDDLSVRLSSPDQLAIERRDGIFFIASSRAPRTRIAATTTNTNARSRSNASRAVVTGDKLEIGSRGDESSADDFYVAFELTNGGRDLRVTRRLQIAGVSEPVVVRSLYRRVADAPNWNIYVEGETERPAADTLTATATDAENNDDAARNRRRDDIAANSTATNTASSRSENAASASAANPLAAEARVLQDNLNEWIAATNRNDIERQLDFYHARLTHYYLARDVGRDAVRNDKRRAFANADVIEIRAAAPELLFTDGNRIALMRFRKQYRVRANNRVRQGEVIQELRWQKFNGAWQITSERDIKVLR